MRDRTIDQWRLTLAREPEIVAIPGQHSAVIQEPGAPAAAGRW